MPALGPSRRGRGGDVVPCDDSRDVGLAPAVRLSAVLDRLKGVVRSNWSMVEGLDAEQPIDALADEVESFTVVDDTEGERRCSTCRERSRKNRLALLEREQRRCQACGWDARRSFGYFGDAALDAHHRVPLSRRPPGRITTSLKDLDLLCATCHRLIHAWEGFDPLALSAMWQIG